MEIINPSKHSTCVILFLFKTFFINLTSFSLNTSQICKTLPDKFYSLRMVANKGESPHSHLTVTCFIFSSHRPYFPVRIMGHSHRRRVTKWNTRYWKASSSGNKQGEWFLFPAYATPLPLPATSSRACTGLPLNSSFIFHSVVLCWGRLSAVTEGHLGLLHSIAHKTLSSDRKALFIFMCIQNIKPY